MSNVPTAEPSENQPAPAKCASPSACAYFSPEQNARHRFFQSTAEVFGVRTKAVSAPRSKLNKLTTAELLWHATGQHADPDPMWSMLHQAQDDATVLFDSFGAGESYIQSRWETCGRLLSTLEVVDELMRRRDDAMAKMMANQGGARRVPAPEPTPAPKDVSSVELERTESALSAAHEEANGYRRALKRMVAAGNDSARNALNEGDAVRAGRHRCSSAHEGTPHPHPSEPLNMRTKSAPTSLHTDPNMSLREIRDVLGTISDCASELWDALEDLASPEPAFTVETTLADGRRHVRSILRDVAFVRAELTPITAALTEPPPALGSSERPTVARRDITPFNLKLVGDKLNTLATAIDARFGDDFSPELCELSEECWREAERQNAAKLQEAV
jgi:hypothetical protein